MGLALAGCGTAREGGGAAGGGGISVVATTTKVSDLVRNVGGTRTEVRGLLTPNADPHDYEPRPSDAQAVAGARAVFGSGGDLDAWLSEVTEGAGGNARVTGLIDRVETIEGGQGHDDEEHAGEEAAEVDPHWWHDPRNARTAVERIRDALSELDPDGSETYAANADAYLAELRALDEAIAACMSSIPAEDRKLVTTHDALGYFADRYGIEVVGLVVPALTTRAQASAGEVAELTEEIEEEGVPTIFPESQLPAGLEQAIADEAGAQVGPGLWTDSLGPQDSGAATYLDAMRFNAQAMADGFGGDCSI